MTKDEMKNRISLALKDPMLQQGFEIICKENAELKKELKISQRCWQDQKNISLDANCSLYKAKDLIRNLLRVTWGEGWNYSLDWKVKAEQFLKENE